MDLIYPPGPASVPPAFTKASSLYKQRAWFALLGLMLFLVLYFGLTAWFVWTAYRIGAGIINGADLDLPALMAGGASAFLAIFMAKALFFVKHRFTTHDIEINSDEQPQLFQFLHKLADEAGAPRPHKVYLSADINAAVFYHLSILNLFFPSKKNLVIGLGLINVLNMSEFKAVLAHEFGHFAQRSMAVGRWVYIAQQIAGAVIAKRDALDTFLQGLSRFDLRFAWIGWVLSLIIWSIRSLLHSVFSIVLLALRALSRQMEFQADLVSVSLTGSDALIHALHKLQTADDAWNRAISFSRTETTEGHGVKDIFTIQSYLLDKLKIVFNDPHYGCIPAVPSQDPDRHRLFSSKMASPPQMWSTHPESSAREENAKKHYISCAVDERPAWLIFNNVETLRVSMTQHILGDPNLVISDIADTLKRLEKKYSRAYLLPSFRGVYLGRSFVRRVTRPHDLFDHEFNRAVTPDDLNQLYPSELADFLNELRSLEEERHHLIALKKNIYKATGGIIRFRGQIIQRQQIPKVIKVVEHDIAAVHQKLHSHDKKCRTLHIAAAKQVAPGWDEYLKSLTALLHYADHAEADLRDVHGFIANTLSVILADGKVSRAELNRLLRATSNAYSVLAKVYDDAHYVSYDADIAKALLGNLDWSLVLGQFGLSYATEDNINYWLSAFETWLNGAVSALSALKYASLEQLLLTEAKVAGAAREGKTLDSAPKLASVPPSYALLLPGDERALQTRLDFWDRFHSASGLFPALARFIVAATIIVGVVFFGQLAAQPQGAAFDGVSQAGSSDIGGQTTVFSSSGNEGH